MQIMQVMQVMQVMQAVKLVSESIRHWVFLDLTNYNCYRCINSTQWLLFICFQRFTFEWQCLFPPYRLCKSNQWIKDLTLTVVCYTKPNHFTHVLFPQYSSLSQAKSNQTKCSTMSSLQIKWFNKYVLCVNTKPNNSAHVLFFAL